MIIPIRCFTCGKLIAHLWEKYEDELQKEYDYDYDYDFLLNTAKEIRDSLNY